MVDESVTYELVKFRQQWKEEINNEHNAEKARDKQNVVGIDVTDVIKEDLHNSPITEVGVGCTDECKVASSACTFGDQNARSSDKPKSSLESKEPEIILLSLPDPESTCSQTTNHSKFIKIGSGDNSHKKQKASNNKKRSGSTNTSLLDQLISDIDEITAIPFFDLQLPREVGMNILSHLTMKDLCQCAVVSKSWKSLADDELLWFNIGLSKGFVSKDCVVRERSNWKEFVQDCVIRDRCLQRRWRERICRISPMEYERGGSLSTVAVWNHLVCTGHSTGNVLLWNLEEHDGPSYKIMEPGQNGQERPCTTCAAVSDNLCTAGFENGSVNIWHTSIPSSPIYRCQTEGPVKTVAIATDKEPTVVAVSDNELRIDVADVNGQWACRQRKTFENKILHMKMLPGSSEGADHQVVIATRDTIQLHSTSPGSNMMLIDHVIGGKITCLDRTADLMAVGVGPYGYGVLGNKVRLYRPQTGHLLSLLSGHYHEITCLNLCDSPPNQLVTGSYDKRVRVFDIRSETLALTLRGHEDYITAVQMDGWKVVSGSNDGTTCVWDQRTGSILWSAHARHPVRHCHFNRVKMLTANIPDDNFWHENLWYADDLILHRKNRGTLRLFDFETENTTLGVPDICLSNYDDTAGYNYNIALVAPYDVIDE